MAVESADRTLDHLYPPFRALLKKALSETSHVLGETWVISEGYRSIERQTYLYAQGRTRPGTIVTWMRSPLWHGTGLAADCLPKLKGFNAPLAWWNRYRQIYLAHGLDNPAWGKGDLGHVQLSDPALRQQALAWVRAGFREPDPIPEHEVRVIVEGEEIPDAGAYLEEGRAWVKLRPVTDALDLVIAEVVAKGKGKKAARVVDELREWLVPIHIEDGQGFARVVDLPAKLTWDGAAKVVTIEGKQS